MSSGSTEGAAPAADRKLASDLADLTKPRITLMVLVTTTLGFLTAGGETGLVTLGLALAGVALLSSGASTLNHVWERKTDALMRRTADRPLPAGRIEVPTALGFGVTLSLVGLAVLAVGVDLLTTLVGAFALGSYVFVYTPIKRVTSLATLVGAVPGALPPVMGWTAAVGNLGTGAWVLFGILFLWQLPHTLAIGWLYRDDYARAGFPMLPVIDPDGRMTSRQAVLYSLALVPVSLLPTVAGLSGVPYLIGALALGMVFLGSSIAFSMSVSMRTARRLMVVSLLYLPAILATMFIDRLL